MKTTEEKPLSPSQQIIVDNLEKFANAPVNVICDITGLSTLLVGNNLKLLMKKELVEVSETIPPTYKLISNKKNIIAPTDKKISKKNTIKKIENDEVILKNEGGRNTNKYIFNKQPFSKSRLVLEIIKTYIADHPNQTLEQVQEVWKSSQIQRRYGVLVYYIDAQKFCENGRERHFMKDSLTIRKKKVVITNQWTDELLVPFLKIAASLKYKITKQ